MNKYAFVHSRFLLLSTFLLFFLRFLPSLFGEVLFAEVDLFEGEREFDQRERLAVSHHCEHTFLNFIPSCFMFLIYSTSFDLTKRNTGKKKLRSSKGIDPETESDVLQ